MSEASHTTTTAAAVAVAAAAAAEAEAAAAEAAATESAESAARALLCETFSPKLHRQLPRLRTPPTALSTLVGGDTVGVYPKMDPSDVQVRECCRQAQDRPAE